MPYAPATPPRDVSWYGDPQKHGARCDICPLKGSTYVPYVKPEGKVRLALVGEGPGRAEVLQRTPFVGPTGEVLNDALEEAGIDRKEAFIVNAALCVGETDEENARAAECCAPRLLKELAEQVPVDAPILPMGKAAAKSVLGVNSILLARGFVWQARDMTDSLKGAEAAHRKLEKDEAKGKLTKNHDRRKVDTWLRVQVLKGRQQLVGRVVMPLLHPTFAFFHNETWQPIFNIDLDRASRFINGKLKLEDLADNIKRVKTIKELKKKERTFIVTDSPEDIAAVAKLLGPELGVDIETERIKPVSPILARTLCVQVSDGKRGIVISPWDPRLHAGPLMQMLKGKTAVFHNGYNFDHVALGRDGVSLDGVKLEDTLVAHHAFASHLPQKLDHVVATFIDSGPWKVRFGVRGAEEKGLAPVHGEEDELAEYGATDAFVTIHAWWAMQGDLNKERSVYEHDKELGLQGQALQVDGILVDRARRDMLSLALKRQEAGLKGRMRGIVRRPYFAPSKLNEVRHILFRVLKAPMISPTKSGLASTSNATLEQLRTGGASTIRRGPADTKQTSGPINNETGDTRLAKFSECLLRWRVALKIRGTYLNAVQIHDDGRAHYTWRPYGTVSGRYSCRLQSCPRWSTKTEDRVREIYCASPDHTLLYFDLSQAEARSAANISGDPVFIENCKKDVHTGNAKILFPEAREVLERDPKGKYCPQHGDEGKPGADCNCGKPFRDVAKNAGFAVAYLAEADTVFAYLRAHGFAVEYDSVEHMLGLLKAAYRRYYEYVDENVRFCQQHGYLRTAITGRIRWFGFHPKPNEIANFPIQSLIADAMNIRSLDLQRRLRKEAPGTKLVAQVHDALIFDTPNKYIVWGTDAKGKPKPGGVVIDEIERTWATPVRVEKSIVCREAREFMLPAEVKAGQRWSDFG